MNLTDLTKWGLVRKSSDKLILFITWVRDLNTKKWTFFTQIYKAVSKGDRNLKFDLTLQLRFIWSQPINKRYIRFSEKMFELQEYVLMNIAWDTFKTFVGLSTLCSCSEAAHDKRWGDGDVLVQQEPGRDAVGCRRGRVEQGAGRGTTWEPCLVWCLSQLTPILTRNRLLIWKGNLTESDWVSLHISNAFCRLMEG